MRSERSGENYDCIWIFKDSGLCPKNLGNHCRIFKSRDCKISVCKISQVAVVRSVVWRGPVVPAGGSVGLQGRLGCRLALEWEQ